MKNIITLLILASSLGLKAQIVLDKNGNVVEPKWIKKEVAHNVYVQFPKEPHFDSKPEKRLSLYATQGNSTDCMFTSMIRNGAMADYDNIKNLPLNQQHEKFDNELNKGIKDFIQDAVIISPITTTNIKNYIVKEVAYTLNNHGKESICYAKFLLRDNTAFIIQCSMDSKYACSNDKDKFLNSITIL